MQNPTDLEQYELPPCALIETLLADPQSVEKSSLAAKLRDQRDKGRASLSKQHDNFNKLCEEVARSDADLSQLEQIAETLLKGERAAGERLRPQMETLQEKLSREGYRLDPEIRKYFQENLDVAAGWLELYKTVRTRLLALSSERRPGPRNILPALRDAGEIDHEALTREIVERFPRILAALAK